MFGYEPPNAPWLYYRVYVNGPTINYVHVRTMNPPPDDFIVVQIVDDETCFDQYQENVDCMTPGFAGQYFEQGSAGWRKFRVGSTPGSFSLEFNQVRKSLGTKRLQSGPQSVFASGGKGWGIGVGGTCGGGGNMNPETFFWLQCPESPGGLFTADTCAHPPPLPTMDPVLYLRSGVTGMEMACNDDNPQCPAAPNRSYLTATLPPGAGLYALYYDFHSPNIPDSDVWSASVDVTVP